MLWFTDIIWLHVDDTIYVEEPNKATVTFLELVSVNQVIEKKYLNIFVSTMNKKLKIIYQE